MGPAGFDVRDGQHECLASPLRQDGPPDDEHRPGSLLVVQPAHHSRGEVGATLHRRGSVCQYRLNRIPGGVNGLELSVPCLLQVGWLLPRMLKRPLQRWQGAASG